MGRLRRRTERVGLMLGIGGGANCLPVWQILSQMGDVDLGKVLQIKSATRSTIMTTTALTYQSITGLSVPITLANAANELHIFACVAGGTFNSFSGYVGLFRDGTEIGQGDDTGQSPGGGGCFISPVGLSYHSINHTNYHKEVPGSVGPFTIDLRLRTGSASQEAIINATQSKRSGSDFGAHAGSSLIVIEMEP